MDLRLHFLEAAGSLGQWRTRMEIEAKAVSSRVDALVAEADRCQPVDVVVRRWPALVIPELGLGGCCYEPNVVTIAVAPESEYFEGSLERGEFGSTLAHELHHAFRHATVGYGATLGESLVSEGLADHFAIEVTGCARPLWTEGRGLSSAVIDEADVALKDYAYDHAAWFFGRGRLPRWSGYALGWHAVQAFLARRPDESAGSLIGTHASTILGEGWSDVKAKFAATN